jgi:hypothetical protein
MGLGAATDRVCTAVLAPGSRSSTIDVNSPQSTRHANALSRDHSANTSWWRASNASRLARNESYKAATSDSDGATMLQVRAAFRA